MHFLVMLMGAAVLLTALYFALVRPLQAYHHASERRYQAAKTSHNLVASVIAEAKALKGKVQSVGAKTKSDQPLRVAVAVTAKDAGVVITRIQPGGQEGLTVWADNVGTQSFYGWLAELERKHQISPDKVSIQKTGTGGRLRVQVQFVGQK